MADYSTEVVIAEQPSNNLGLAGFITALVGLVTCGLLSPIGALLSFFGMFFRPRGFAFAGLLIGLVGSLWILAVTLFFSTILVTSFAAMLGMPEVATFARLGVATSMVEEFRSSNGRLPDANDWAQLDSTSPLSFMDGWETPLDYRVLEDGRYEIRSAGPDKLIDTDDDITTDTTSSNWFGTQNNSSGAGSDGPPE